MKKKRIDEIADKLGVTKSTVSRTLRHCHNVDSDTRRTILREFGKEALFSDGYFPVYVILPDNPNHFWARLYEELAKHERTLGLPVKYNIYTNLSGTDIVLHYLEEAERIGSKAVIIAAVITPEIRKKLIQMQEHCAIFLLCEFGDIVNTFYFGPDYYADGRSAAQFYLDRYPDHKAVTISLADIRGIEMKNEGFCDRVRECKGKDAVREYVIDVETSLDSRLFASKLAYKLSEWLSNDEKYCLYIPFGSGNIAAGIRKTGMKEKIICICHDTKPTADSSGIYAVYINQNLPLQAEAVFKAAEKYLRTGCLPDQKFTYIPSVICDASHGIEESD